MTPLLHYELYGTRGPYVIILHGLFGSGKNWVSIARQLSPQYRVLVPDARNHGKSFHHSEHSVAVMAQDLRQLILSLSIQKPVLLGHSMGGLTAMRYTLLHTTEVNGLIVADIAPRTYNIRYTNEFAALNMDVSRYSSRREIDAALAAVIPDVTIRQFLQTNIEANPSGGYRWVLNVPALQNAERRADPELSTGMVYNGPTLFLRSLRENFITDADIPLIRKYFPAAEIHNFSQGNHWLHITEPDFLPVVMEFLQKNHPP